MPVGREALDDRVEDRPDVAARREGATADEREEVSLGHDDSVDRRAARGAGDLRRVDAGKRGVHRLLVGIDLGIRVVGKRRGDALRDRRRRDDPDLLRRLLRSPFCREADVRIVREHDHMLGADRGDRLEQLTDGRVRRRTALDDDQRAFAAKNLPVPASLRDGDERGGRRRSGRRRLELREPALPLGSLAMHVADLDPHRIDHADRASEVERALRLVGVDMDLRDRDVAGHQQRVAKALERRAEPVEVEVVPLDDERRAEPARRLLLVDRLLRQLVDDVGNLGERLARQLV